MHRRQILKSAFGALALVGGVQRAIAQTPQRRVPPSGCGTRAGADGPDYALLSTAVLSSNGLAAGKVWTGINTGNLKSDDLFRAATLLRVQTDHFEEIRLNAYVDAQFSQQQNELYAVNIPPNVIHTIGEQFRSYGILMTDTQIQGLYPSNQSAIQQALLYGAQVGIRGVHNEIADSFDLAAKKLRLQEIATACGELLEILPSSRPMQANAFSPQASTFCSDWQTRIDNVNIAAGVLALAAFVGCPECGILAAAMFIEAEVAQRQK